jgi:hypothetical protein
MRRRASAETDMIQLLIWGKFVQYGSQVLPNLPEQQLLAVLWCEHDMVLALPCRMVQVVATL